MTDRPTPPSPDPQSPDHPGPTGPAAADDTAVLPEASASAAAPAGPGPAAPQPWPGHEPQAGYGPPPGHGPAATGAAAAPRGWWREATSTGGGRAALAAAGAVTVVAALVGVALLGGLVGRVVGWGHHDRMGVTAERGPLGDGDRPGRSEEAPGRQGPGRGDGDRPMGRGADPAQPYALPDDAPQGMRGGMGRGLGLLGGDILHGEFTSQSNGTPTVMLVQTGEVTTYTSGRSLTVRSSDGFTATYSLDGSVTPSGGVARLATGVQVRVVAAKEGMKVTRLVVVTSP